MRNALIEVSDRLSAAPASLVAEGASEAVPAPRSGRSLGAAALISGSLDTLARRAGEGHAPAAAAFAMIADTPRPRLDDVAAAIDAKVREAGNAEDGGSSGEWSSRALYALASDADADKREGDAVVILCTLAGTDWGEADGCLGLAVIAARRKRFDEALALASFFLKSEARHPRALCIVGICELERGNVSGAQSYLAAAARIARSNPLFRGDLQAAQRALLLMHLS